MQPADLERAARETIDALRQHADLLQEHPNADMTDASAALAEALTHYDAALAAHRRPHIDELSSLASRLLESEEEEDEDDEEEGLPAGARVSVWTRSDFVITDPDRLIAVGRDRYAKSWPDEQPDEVAEAVSTADAALLELMHYEGLPLDEYGEEHGLRHAGDAYRIKELQRVLQDYPSLEEPENPFALDNDDAT